MLRRDLDQPLGDNALWRYMAGRSVGLNPLRARRVERFGIGWVQVACQRKAIAIAALDDEDHGRPLARLGHGRQFPKMLGAAGGFAVRELCKALLAHQVDVLDLHIDRRRFLVEQDVDPRVFTVFHLSAECLETRQLGKQASPQGFLGQRVGMHRVDAHKRAVRLDEFQRRRQFALGIGAQGHIGARTGRAQPQHGAGVGAMRRDFLTVKQAHIGEKALISAQKDCLCERSWKLHGLGLALLLARAQVGCVGPRPAVGPPGGWEIEAMSDPKGESEHVAAGSRVVTAAVLLIGDELLSGRTRDINLQTIAQALGPIGVRVVHAQVVGDEHERIVEAVRALSEGHDYVFTTGGIGPTHDDITADAVAAAMDAPLRIDPEARRIIEERHSGELNEARLRMARIPEGATLIANPVSGAPGFQIGNVFVMAGVPKICEAMLGDVLPRLKGGERIESFSVKLPGGREGDLAQALGELQAEHEGVSFGSYPYFRAVDDYGVEIVARAEPGPALDEAKAALKRLSESIAR